MVMSKEPTWLEAATKILEGDAQVWMTAPELVRTIEKAGIRSLRSDYGQAVRTLRSALNIEVKKHNGKFSRKDYNYNCYFALKKKLNDSNSDITARSPAKRALLKRKRKSLLNHSPKTSQSPPPIVHNGLSSTPTTPLTPSTHSFYPTTPTVEINPEVDHRQMDESSGLCLPSPLTSLLGPRRVMTVLNETMDTAMTRPMREARKRRITRDYENEDPIVATLSNGPISPSPTQPLDEILQLEICHPLPCLCSVVNCVRSPSIRPLKSITNKEDPCTAQGLRITSQSIEINPDYVHKDDSDTSIFTESESEEDGSFCLQPTPSSQLLMKRRRHRQRSSLLYNNEDLSESEASAVESSQPQPETEYVPVSLKRPRPSKPRGSVSSVKSIMCAGNEERMGGEMASSERVSKPVEHRRHVSTLFLPSSPLVNENLKVLLGMTAFEKLSNCQKQKLVVHLPSVDQQNGTSVPADCFTNSFYSSAVREWGERVAIGMFTAEYKARVRGEEKRKMSIRLENSWKEQYYERHYGDKTALHREDSPPPYYPYNPPNAQSELLMAIVDGHFNREPVMKDRPPPQMDKPPQPPSPSVSVVSPPKTSSNSICTQLKKNTSIQQKKTTTKSTLKPLKNAVNKSLASQKNPLTKGLKKSIKSKQNKQAKSPSEKNSTIKKRNATFSALLSGKSKAKKAIQKSAVKRLGKSTKSLSSGLVHKLLSSKSNLSRELLTRLPAKISYQEILNKLIIVSGSSPAVNATELLTMKAYTAPFPHTHSVFHDHFALLSKEHVPVDFCFRVASLPLSLPLQYFSKCMQTKAILREHSYAQINPHNKSLTLSLPRSLLVPKNGYVCGNPAMVFCSLCRCLYHSDCTNKALCPSCFVRLQTDTAPVLDRVSNFS